MRHEARQVPSWLIFDVSQGMKIAVAALVALSVVALASAKDLFAARCVPALTKKEFTWRVEETPRGVIVRYSDPRERFSTEVTATDAASLRTKIAGLRLSQADLDFLRSREVKLPDGRILLRPFDGVVYHFTMPSGASLMIDNPAFDLERQPSFEETARLRDVMDFIEQLTRIAKKENRANKAPEPTPGAVTPRATEGASK